MRGVASCRLVGGGQVLERVPPVVVVIVIVVVVGTTYCKVVVVMMVMVIVMVMTRIQTQFLGLTLDPGQTQGYI